MIKFKNALIEAAKEEANTSALNQAYDQHIAKQDKLNIREKLDHVRMKKSFTTINQMKLVVICISGLVSKEDPDQNKKAWIASFKKVNCHPCYRTPFKEWTVKIEQHLETGNRFFVKRTSLFDAMPAVWKRMDINTRHAVVNLIDKFYMNNTAVWCIDNIKQLVHYVKLDEIQTIRTCYFATQQDLSVIAGSVTEAPIQQKSNQELLGVDSRFC